MSQLRNSEDKSQVDAPESSDPIEIMLKLGAYFAATVILASFLMSFFKRYTGSPWSEIGPIGDFWGGHLNGLALVFLALSLLYQRKAFQRQAIQVKRQNDLSAQQVDSLRFHFLLERIQVEGERLRFSLEEPGADDDPSHQRKALLGVSELELHSHAIRTRQSHAIVDHECLDRIIKLHKAGIEILKRPSMELESSGHLLLASFVPKIIIYIDNEKAKDISKEIENFVELAKGHSFDEQLAANIVALIKDGWDCSHLNPQKKHWTASLKHELIERTEEYGSGDEKYLHLGHAYAAALEQMRQARRDGL